MRTNKLLEIKMNIALRKLTKKDLPAFSMLWQFYQYHQSNFDNEDIDSQADLILMKNTSEVSLRVTKTATLT